MANPVKKNKKIGLVQQLPVKAKRKEPNTVARRRSKLEEMDANELSVVDQVWLACRKDNISATIGGFLLGGLVPLMSFMEAHYDLKVEWWFDPKALLVLGGLIFSFYTVYHWGKKAFGSIFKAAGFVVLVEGTMVFSNIQWLAITALVFLITINGVATGIKLALDRWRPGFKTVE